VYLTRRPVYLTRRDPAGRGSVRAEDPALAEDLDLS
jgi:hypothetical protein